MAGYFFEPITPSPRERGTTDLLVADGVESLSEMNKEAIVEDNEPISLIDVESFDT